MAAVVRVQHLRAQIPAGGTTVTLVAGVDYDAPASLSSAFVDLKTHFNPSAGDQGMYVEDIATHRNPKDLLNSITLTKTTTQPGVLYCAIDIVEYVGPPGGQFEFIVRDQGYLSDATFGTTPTLTGPALSGVGNVADVMLLISSSGAGFSGALQIQNAVLKTAELVGLVPTFTSGVVVYTDGPHGLSYQAIEWVGPAYTVHRVESTLQTPNTHPLGFTVANLAKTFSHYQYTMEGDWNNFNSDSVLWMHELQATSYVSQKSGGTSTYPSPKHVAWIVEVDDTGASQPFNVTRYAPTGLTSTGPTSGFSITAVRDLAQSGIGAYSHLWSKNDGRPFGVGGSSDAYLATTTEIQQRMPELAVPYSVNLEVIEWPEVTAGVQLKGTSALVSGGKGTLTIPVAVDFSGTSALTTVNDGVLTIPKEFKGWADLVTGGRGDLLVVPGRFLDGVSNLVFSNRGNLQVSKTFTGTSTIITANRGNLVVSDTLQGTSDLVTANRGQLLIARQVDGTADIFSGTSGNLFITRSLDGESIWTSGGRGELSIGALILNLKGASVIKMMAQKGTALEANSQEQQFYGLDAISDSNWAARGSHPLKLVLSSLASPNMTYGVPTKLGSANPLFAEVVRHNTGTIPNFSDLDAAATPDFTAGNVIRMTAYYRIDASTVPGIIYSVRGANTSTERFRLGISSTGGASFDYRDGVNSIGRTGDAAGVDSGAVGWHLVEWTFDGVDTFAIFIDGIAGDTFTFPGITPNSTTLQEAIVYRADFAMSIAYVGVNFGATPYTAEDHLTTWSQLYARNALSVSKVFDGTSTLVSDGRGFSSHGKNFSGTSTLTSGGGGNFRIGTPTFFDGASNLISGGRGNLFPERHLNTRLSPILLVNRGRLSVDFDPSAVMDKIYDWGTSAIQNNKPPPFGHQEGVEEFKDFNDAWRMHHAVLRAHEEMSDGSHIALFATADDYIVTQINEPIEDYFDGLRVRFRMTNTTSKGAYVTFQIQDFGSRPIVHPNGDYVRPDTFVANGIYSVIYKNNQWQLLGNSERATQWTEVTDIIAPTYTIDRFNVEGSLVVFWPQAVITLPEPNEWWPVGTKMRLIDPGGNAPYLSLPTGYELINGDLRAQGYLTTNASFPNRVQIIDYWRVSATEFRYVGAPFA